jgi:hypothetical protein
MNWTTFSPIPSSSFVKSLVQANNTVYEKYIKILHTYFSIN